MSQRQMSENPTPISDALTRSKNSREGMQVLARGLDEVLQRLDALAVPVVDEWTAAAWSLPEPDPGLPWVAPTAIALAGDQAAATAAVQAQLDAATDPDDIRALEAQLRLLQDTDANQREAVPQGKRYQQTGDIAELVPASPERRQLRKMWALEHNLHTFLPQWADDPDGLAEVFAKGGPMWLYLDGREAIMQMPYEWRAWLVADIAVDSEAEAQEIGADILKHRGSADKQITIDSVHAMSDARG